MWDTLGRYMCATEWAIKPIRIWNLPKLRTSNDLGRVFWHPLLGLPEMRI